MGNIHDCGEVATLVPQGNLMPFHHHSTIGLVVLAMPKSLFVNYLRYGLGPNVACVINMFNRAISLSLLLIFSSSFAWLVLRAFISMLEQIEQHLLVDALESNIAEGYYS
jgi:hypothetical protein